MVIILWKLWYEVQILPKHWVFYEFSFLNLPHQTKLIRHGQFFFSVLSLKHLYFQYTSVSICPLNRETSSDSSALSSHWHRLVKLIGQKGLIYWKPLLTFLCYLYTARTQFSWFLFLQLLQTLIKMIHCSKTSVTSFIAIRISPHGYNVIK